MAAGKKTGGRVKGTPNKIPADLKDAILEAARQAGGEEEMVGYLRTQAVANPAPFLSLLGRVLGITVQGPGPNGEHKQLIGWLPRTLQSPTKNESTSGHITTPTKDGASS